MRMRKLLLFGILGLWPLGVAVVWVVAGAIQFTGTQHDYWSAAPWIIVGGIAMCGITMLLALAASFVFNRAEGGPLRRGLLAGLVYVGALVLFVAYGKSIPL